MGVTDRRSLADPEIRQSEARQLRRRLQLFGAGPREAHLCLAAIHASEEPRFRGPSVQRRKNGIKPCALCGSRDTYLDEIILDDRGGRMFVCSDTDHCAQRARRGGRMTGRPCSPSEASAKLSGARVGCEKVSFDFGRARSSAIVGESGSGKTTLLKCLSGQVTADGGPRALRDCATAAY